MGVYPDVTLKSAREKHQTARSQLAEGINPNDVKKVEKLTRDNAADGSFEVIAMEWYTKEAIHWSDSHSKRVKANLEKDLIPHIGHRQPNDISAPELLAVLRLVCQLAFNIDPPTHLKLTHPESIIFLCSYCSV